MSPVLFLLLPVVLSAVGCVLLTLRMSSWPSRSTQADLDAFKRRMDVLARGARKAPAMPIPAVVKSDPPRLSPNKLKFGDD